MSTLATILILVPLSFVTGWLVSKSYFSTLGDKPRIEPNPDDTSRLSVSEQRSRYKRRFRALQKLVERQEGNRDDIREQLGAMSKSLQKRDRAVAKMQTEMDSQRNRARAVEEELNLLRIERDELAARVSRQQGTAAPSNGAEPSRRNEKELRAELGALREALANRDHRLRQVEIKLNDSQKNHEIEKVKVAEWKKRVQPLTHQIRKQRDLIRGLKGIETVTDTSPVAGPPVPQDEQPDDLQKIRGIGPALERRLKAHGISRYRHIANLDNTALSEIAAKIAIAENLPERDKWIEQARMLQQMEASVAD